MGRMARSRQDNCEMELFGWAVGRLGGWAENRPHLEQTNVAVSHGPVVLDAPDQPRKQATSEVGLFGRERIQDRHGVRPVGGAEGQRSGFEKTDSARDEMLPNAPQRELGGRVGGGAGAAGAQPVREGGLAGPPG